MAGLNADWESEGYDRPDLSLPGRTNDLISAVAKANPKTVVVLQGGSALAMPWINDVQGVVFGWYLGNECGNALSDIIYGRVNPSGRLPLSFPVRDQDIAASTNYKSARTKIQYEEGIWVGYKHHNVRSIPPLFPFGHGLSFTSFSYSDLKITSAPEKGAKAEDWKLEVSVKVKNDGKVAGSHSVHFYTCPPGETATSLKHPQWSLQAFAKVYDLKPGAEETVKVALDKCKPSLLPEGKADARGRCHLSLGRCVGYVACRAGRMGCQGRSRRSDHGGRSQVYHRGRSRVEGSVIWGTICVMFGVTKMEGFVKLLGKQRIEVMHRGTRRSGPFAAI